MRDTAASERVVVTGASGFIGTHLVRALRESGVAPILLGRDAAATVAVDLLDAASVRAAVAHARPDVVFHLAGTRGVGCGDNAASLCAALNVQATAIVVEEAARAGARRIVLVGSADEYGRHAGPLREDQALEPASFYAITKAAATRLALALHATHAAPVVVLRPFTVYGPGQSESMFVGEAVMRAVDGRPFRMSHGEQRRDLVYVDDVVRALLAAGSAPGAEGRVINIGSGVARRLRDVADAVWRLSGTQAELLVGARPAAATETHDTWADISLAGEILDWRPRTGLEEGLGRTIDWARGRARSGEGYVQ